MKNSLLAILILTGFTANAQNSQTEFEGVITYKTTIVIKDKSLDSNDLYRVFGRERQYYFKAGKFKWVPKNVRLEYEVFNPSVSKSEIADKFHSNDTIYYKDLGKIPDSVVAVKKGKSTTILNIPCTSAIFTVANESEGGSKIFRTIYYSQDSLQYAGIYYDGLRAMGQSFISRYTKSIPLRLELDSKEQPFSIVYEATGIEWRKLPDNLFAIDGRLPSKR